MEKIFVDTSAWLALYDKRDKYHRSAKEILIELKNKKLPLVTTDYIFDETVTYANRTYGYSFAVKVGEILRQSAVAQIAELDTEAKDAAWEIFKKHGAMKLSFTDCTSFTFMRQKHLTRAFAFDDDFSKLGFKVLR